MRLLLVVVVFGASCTKANPIDCGDGNCTDPAHPFCDSDGSLEGHPNTCIAVSCTPMAFAECRGDEAIVCDATGTNYSATTCEHGCDTTAQGCVACVDNSECAPSKPTCDAQTHTCRACAIDADCASNVCDKANGTCRDESTVIYAAPDGAVAGLCGDQAHPCSIEQAFQLLSAVKNAIRLAPGNYSSNTLTVMLSATATLFGDGATLFANVTPTLDVEKGGRLVIEGLTLTQNATLEHVIDCITQDAAVPSSLELDRVTVSGIPVTTAVILAEGCDVAVKESRFTSTGDAIHASKLNTRPSTVTIDRTMLQGTRITAGAPSTDLSVIRVENSMLVRSQIGQGIEVAFSTLVDTPLSCTQFSAPYPKVTNSILYGTMGVDVCTTPGNACAVSYDLMTPQSQTVIGVGLSFNSDPKFKNPGAQDFHLQLGSPAINAADPTAPDAHDFDGTSRPQGAASDIGAFEFH